MLSKHQSVFSLVRDQDLRELNQADLSEVDPEENSAEFMGILIKVKNAHLSTTTSVLVVEFKTHKSCCFFSSGSGQVEENPRDHQSHNGASGTRAEADCQEVHHTDSGPRLPERRESGPGEPAEVQYTATQVEEKIMA